VVESRLLACAIRDNRLHLEVGHVKLVAALCSETGMNKRNLLSMVPPLFTVT